MNILQASQTAVDRIIADLSDRRGLSGQWDGIDSDVQAEIRENWGRIIREALMEPSPTPDPLARSIAEAINRHSAENDSNTPDFILADFLTACLAAFNTTQASRNRWYGREDTPANRVQDQPESLVEVLILESLWTMSRRARAAFDAATQVEELHAARAKILGKDGELTGVLQNLGQLSGNKRRDYGLRANDVRFEIDQAFEAKLSSLTSGGWSL